MNLNLLPKLVETRRIIETVAEEFQRPVLMWSSGKDSMVLLWILRSMGWHGLPVLFHRDPWFPHKYEFAERIIRERELTVLDYPPSQVSLQKSNGVLEVVNHYQVGPTKTCALPRNLVAPTDASPRESFVCGLQDVLHRPLGAFGYPWDVVLHGHKSTDVDPLLGPVPLHVDFKLNVGGPAVAFPLRHWTDADIWAYTRQYDVPQQPDRYNPETGQENPDKTHNPDYLPCCTRCLDRDGPAQVRCPKLLATVDNISAQVPYTEPVRLSYFGAAPAPAHAV